MAPKPVPAFVPKKGKEDREEEKKSVNDSWKMNQNISSRLFHSLSSIRTQQYFVSHLVYSLLSIRTQQYFAYSLYLPGQGQAPSVQELSPEITSLNALGF